MEEVRRGRRGEGDWLRSLITNSLICRRLASTVTKSRARFFTKVEDGISRVGLLDSSFDSDARGEAGGADDDSTSESSDGEMDFGGRRVDCGTLNSGARIDYVLQEKEIESTNEYLFALGAHSMYWSEKDLSYFIAKELLRNA